jgi:hypothetical protein
MAWFDQTKSGLSHAIEIWLRYPDGSEGEVDLSHLAGRGRGERLLVIENIPYVFCSRCGERHVTAATMREIER